MTYSNTSAPSNQTSFTVHRPMETVIPLLPHANSGCCGGLGGYAHEGSDVVARLGGKVYLNVSQLGDVEFTIPNSDSAEVGRVGVVGGVIVDMQVGQFQHDAIILTDADAVCGSEGLIAAVSGSTLTVFNHTWHSLEPVLTATLDLGAGHIGARCWVGSSLDQGVHIGEGVVDPNANATTLRVLSAHHAARGFHTVSPNEDGTVSVTKTQAVVLDQLLIGQYVSRVVFDDENAHQAHLEVFDSDSEGVQASTTFQLEHADTDPTSLDMPEQHDHWQLLAGPVGSGSDYHSLEAVLLVVRPRAQRYEMVGLTTSVLGVEVESLCARTVRTRAQIGRTEELNEHLSHSSASFDEESGLMMLHLGSAETGLHHFYKIDMSVQSTSATRCAERPFLEMSEEVDYSQNPFTANRFERIPVDSIYGGSSSESQGTASSSSDPLAGATILKGTFTHPDTTTASVFRDGHLWSVEVGRSQYTTFSQRSSAAICFPGEYRAPGISSHGGGLRCRKCPEGKTSGGGLSDQCYSCGDITPASDLCHSEDKPFAWIDLKMPVDIPMPDGAVVPVKIRLATAGGQWVDSLYIVNVDGSAPEDPGNRLSLNWATGNQVVEFDTQNIWDSHSPIVYTRYMCGTAAGLDDIAPRTQFFRSDGLLFNVDVSSKITDGVNQQLFCAFEAMNAAGLWSSYESEIWADFTPPIITLAWDGWAPTELASQPMEDTAFIRWEYTDPEARPDRMGLYLAVGTTPGGSDVAEWAEYKDPEERLVQFVSGLEMQEGTTYYTSVKLTNEAGIESAITSTDGFKLGGSAPLMVDPLDPGLENETNITLSGSPAARDCAWDPSTCPAGTFWALVPLSVFDGTPTEVWLLDEADASAEQQSQIGAQPSGVQGLGVDFIFTVTGKKEFAEQIEISFTYDNSYTIPLAAAGQPGLLFYDETESRWRDATETCHPSVPIVWDSVQRVVTATVCHTTHYKAVIRASSDAPTMDSSDAEVTYEVSSGDLLVTVAGVTFTDNVEDMAWSLDVLVDGFSDRGRVVSPTSGGSSVVTISGLTQSPLPQIASFCYRVRDHTEHSSGAVCNALTFITDPTATPQEPESPDSPASPGPVSGGGGASTRVLEAAGTTDLLPVALCIGIAILVSALVVLVVLYRRRRKSSSSSILEPVSKQYSFIRPKDNSNPRLTPNLNVAPGRRSFDEQQEGGLCNLLQPVSDAGSEREDSLRSQMDGMLNELDNKSDHSGEAEAAQPADEATVLKNLEAGQANPAWFSVDVDANYRIPTGRSTASSKLGDEELRGVSV